MRKLLQGELATEKLLAWEALYRVARRVVEVGGAACSGENLLLKGGSLFLLRGALGGFISTRNIAH